MTKVIPIRDDIIRRFWNLTDVVEDHDSCWEWKGARRSQDGYGCFSVSGKIKIGAHRYSYLATWGQIPDGHVVDHACRNKSCVRPSHLRAVTVKQNGENRSGANPNTKTGIRGVTVWRGRYMVNMRHNGRSIYGGLFDDLDAAGCAARELRSQLFTHSDADV